MGPSPYHYISHYAPTSVTHYYLPPTHYISHYAPTSVTYYYLPPTTIYLTTHQLQLPTTTYPLPLYISLCTNFSYPLLPTPTHYISHYAPTSSLLHHYFI